MTRKRNMSLCDCARVRLRTLCSREIIKTEGEFWGNKKLMRLADIFKDKSIKKIDARAMIIDGILRGDYTIEEIESISNELKDNKISTILEAIEEISNKELIALSLKYLEFAKKYISSKDNSCKREASRIVGNMASQYPQAVRDCIPALLDNVKADGTVIRWGSAYALSRIILLEEYCNSDLYEELVTICDNEQENGVRNQYLKAFKKIKNRRTNFM